MLLPTIDIDGIATHYEVSGSGPPILLMALKLQTLILPGHTDFHATSCARYLEECIAGAAYWDVHLESQPPDGIRDRILDFFPAHAGAGVHAG
jgi:hypothetical protein